MSRRQDDYPGAGSCLAPDASRAPLPPPADAFALEAPLALVVFDANARIAVWSLAATAILGWEQAEMLGRDDFAALVGGGQRRALDQRFRAGEPFAGEFRLRRRDGTTVTVSVSASPILCGASGSAGFVTVLADLTARRRAEIELRHLQKLQSIGRLASGIAHEINTPIQYVGHSIEFMRDALASLEPLIRAYQEVCAAGGAADVAALERVRSLEHDSDLDYVLENIPRACDRALTGIERVADIVRAMRRFASPASGEMVCTDLNEAIRTTLTVARNEYRYVAGIELQLEPLPAVACQLADIRQVLLGLIVNAADAIAVATEGSDETGRITLRSWRDGEDVVVSVADTGCGIPEEHRDHIFEPFFTTKDASRRMGYDLATARYILQRHDGQLSFDSDPGRGTTFTLRLPLKGAAAGNGAAP